MAVSSLPPRKQQTVRTKSVSKKAASSTWTPFQSKLSSIESSLSSSSNLNPLFDLIELLGAQIQSKSADAELLTLHRGIKFLVRSFQALLKDNWIPLTEVDGVGLVQGAFRIVESQTEADKAVSQWLRQRWNEAIQLLCDALLHTGENIRLLAMSSLMSLQRDASSQLSIQMSPSADERMPQWSASPWNLLVITLLADSSKREASIAQDVINAFCEDYLEQYDDVRYAFCKDVIYLLRTPPSHLQNYQYLRSNAISILWGLTAIPTKEEDLNNFLITELQAGRQSSKKKKSIKKKEGNEEDEEMEDWFSDSDEEGVKQKHKNGSAGLGKAAQAATSASNAKKQRKRNPPLREAVYSLNSQKAIFSRAWLAVLLPMKREGQDGKTTIIGGPLTLQMMHEALVRMHSQILPHLVKPNLLHDFLVDCLDAGGATSLLALNALFFLMTTHNLNYPSFYHRLYDLLRSDPPFLHVRYRSRFLRLLDVFLSSTHLPAALVASFAKRLSRVALRAPPAAIAVVIPFVWNLCKRHKQCLGLLHREFGGDRFALGPAGVEDPFNENESNPLQTGAIDSSLWELAAMGASVSLNQTTFLVQASIGAEIHYLASVASLSKILAEPFTKERYDLEDFLDLTYGTLFESETAKTLKKREGKKIAEPALEYSLPNRNGKRLSILGGEVAQKDGEESRKKRALEEVRVVGEDEDEAEEEEKLAMKKVQAESAKIDDACARYFTL